MVVALPNGDPPKKDDKDKKYTTECKTEYKTTHTVVTKPYTTYTDKTIHVPETKTKYIPKTEVRRTTPIVCNVLILQLTGTDIL